MDRKQKEELINSLHRIDREILKLKKLGDAASARLSALGKVKDYNPVAFALSEELKNIDRQIQTAELRGVEIFELILELNKTQEAKNG